MSTFTEKKLGTNLIASGSNTTIYTVPSATTGIIKTLLITNVSSSAALATIWHIPSGSVSTDSNALIKNLSIPTADFTHISTYIVMSAQDILQAQSNLSGSITISSYGAELT
jgi:hypothetical protein